MKRKIIKNREREREGDEVEMVSVRVLDFYKCTVWLLFFTWQVFFFIHPEFVNSNWRIFFLQIKFIYSLFHHWFNSITKRICFEWIEWRSEKKIIWITITYEKFAFLFDFECIRRQSTFSFFFFLVITVIYEKKQHDYGQRKFPFWIWINFFFYIHKKEICFLLLCVWSSSSLSSSSSSSTSKWIGCCCCCCCQAVYCQKVSWVLYICCWITFLVITMLMLMMMTVVVVVVVGHP